MTSAMSFHRGLVHDIASGSPLVGRVMRAHLLLLLLAYISALPDDMLSSSRIATPTADSTRCSASARSDMLSDSVLSNFASSGLEVDADADTDPEADAGADIDGDVDAGADPCARSGAVLLF